MCLDIQSKKFTFAALMISIAMGITSASALSAEGLSLSTGNAGAGDAARPGKLSAGPDAAKGPSSDAIDRGIDRWLKACHAWGGGGSTEPDGHTRCTRPDGTSVVDS